MTPLALLAALAIGGLDPVADDPKPVVVLIGDSIRMGYAPFVIEALGDRATVISPEPNGGDSSNVLGHLDEWVISKRPAVVHLNAGLHDLKLDREKGTYQVPIDEYRANLEAIRERLEAETSARLIFATTTPVDDARHRARKPFDRREADVRRYNEAARDVLDRSAFRIDDLHALVTDELDPQTALVADGVHFTEEAYRKLGARVASEILRALDEPEATREAACRRAAKPPTIDGTIDEDVWNAAELIDAFPTFWAGRASTGSTKARLLWDDEALYFAAAMTDEELRAFGTKRNDMLWNGDVFELFFKPSESEPAYYEFQVNPRSVILELAFPRRGFDFATLAAKPPMGFVAAAKTDGTLDKPGDTDRGWTVEGKIPWRLFAPTGGRPAVGATWRFALCRYDYGPEGTEPVLTSSAPLSRPSFHRYEDYGRLTFEGPKE
jgi:lysophospholipase L1-like esterase